MYGFQLIVNGKQNKSLDKVLYSDNVECRNYMIKKFDQDKCFQDTGDLLIILDGVILNKSELQQKYPAQDWGLTLRQMYLASGDTFFSQLRGSFAGAIYDKNKEKLIVFTDQLGSRFIYYAYDETKNVFCCSEMMGEMYRLLQEQEIDYNLSPYATKVMLTYGFMIEDYTLCEQVKKIEPGCYLSFQNKELAIERYYLLDNTPLARDITEQEAIDEVDRLFRQAVNRQFRKDEEYGYEHICSLSGGLDCRMTSFVAHHLGYTRQLNCTFSQSGYLDQTISQEIASYLKHEWVFKALDNGIWLYDVDEVTSTTGGNVLYYGTAHGNSLMKYINFERLGLLHSGQLGDVVISSIISSIEKDNAYEIGSGAYSQKYLNALEVTPAMKGVNKEIGYYYYRFLNGTNNGIQNVYNYTETLSPFMDLDFLEYCLHLPVELRQNHKLYKQWIINKYPDAARFAWETTGCKIDSKMIKIGKKERHLAMLPNIILGRLGLRKRDTDSKNHMNPVGYYISNNSELREHLSSYYKYVDYIEDDEVKMISKSIITEGSSMEKIQLVTLLAAVKLFYVKNV